MISEYYIRVIPDWTPHYLEHCLQSLFAARVDVFTSAFIVVLYLGIVWVWWKALKQASRNGKIVFGCLIVIFVMCDMGGYASRIITYWQPQIGFLARIFAMVFNVLACMVFLRVQQLFDFRLLGKKEAIGGELAMEFPDLLHSTEAEQTDAIKSLKNDHELMEEIRRAFNAGQVNEEINDIISRMKVKVKK